MLRNLVRLSVAVIVIALAVSLRPAGPASAYVHQAEISEIMVGLDGDPDVQFVEINMRFPAQIETIGSHLASFDASGTFIDADAGTMGDQPLITFPGNVSNDGNGVRWIIGTPAFAAQQPGGITPDFILPPSPGMPPDVGMVCLFDSSQDFTDPSNSIDCVAYGGVSFTGTNPNWTNDGSAHPSGPGDGYKSLTRTTPATIFAFENPPFARSEDSSAFSLVCPTPENNAGEIAILNDCGVTPTPTPTITPTPTNTPTPTSTATPTSTPTPKDPNGDTDGDATPNSIDPDDDNDGCTDVQELDVDETLGGRRNPHNPHDFYDVAIAGAVQGQDKQIDLFNDIVSVIDHYAPTGLEPEYDVWYDRGPSAGPNSWNLTAPDGKIDLFNDIVGVIGQFGHDCR